MQKTVLFLIAILAFVSPAGAGEAPVLTGTHQDWKTYRFKDNGRDVCFMSSQPQRQEGHFKKRGEVFFFVTLWPEENDKTVISLSMGYSFKPGSDAIVKVGEGAFALKTSGEMAWTKNEKMDAEIVEALKQGARLTVAGTSARGTPTFDTYSLKGSAAALRAITQACPAKTVGGEAL